MITLIIKHAIRIVFKKITNVIVFAFLIINFKFSLFNVVSNSLKLLLNAIIKKDISKYGMAFNILNIRKFFYINKLSFSNVTR